MQCDSSDLDSEALGKSPVRMYEAVVGKFVIMVIVAMIVVVVVCFAKS